MMITWNERGLSKGNIQNKTKFKERILLNLLLQLLHLHDLLLLQVQVKLIMKENIPININMK